MPSVLSRPRNLSSCGDIFHPWNPNSCWKGGLYMVISGAAFTTPCMLLFHLAKIALRISKHGTSIAKQEFRKLPFRVINSVLFGCLLGGGFIAAACNLRRILGRLTYPTIAFLPGVICGFSNFCMNLQDLRVFIDSFYGMSVEYFVRIIVGGTKGRNERGTGLETIVFAFINAGLAYLQCRDVSRAHIPWFHWPERTSNSGFSARPASVSPVQGLLSSRHPTCKHDDTCLENITRGVLKYAAAGSVISLIRYGISKIRSYVSFRSKSPSFSWTLPAFLAAYVAIFRVSRCFLTWNYGEDSSLDCAISGLLSGFAYAINPDLSILSVAFASASELLWRRVAESGVLPEKLRWCPRLICALCFGIMFEARTHGINGTCPPGVTLMIDGCSGGLSRIMVDGYRKRFGLPPMK